MRTEQNRKQNKKKYIYASIVSLLIVIIIVASVLYKGQSSASKGEKEQPIETATKEKVQKVDAEPVKEENTPKDESKQQSKEKPKVDENGYIKGQQLPSEPTYIKGILIANKKYPLPADFSPGVDPEANAALNTMSAAAKVNGFELTAFSSFRSYDYQKQLYMKYVNKDGQAAADRYSARPGYSEHQTGLAFDIGEVGNEDVWLTDAFGETPAGQWLVKHAHEYGFILRYPKGKEDITGYMYESWHFRYVGIKLAKEIYEKNVTLEEYLNIQ